jgi:hypothetical protein
VIGDWIWPVVAAVVVEASAAVPFVRTRRLRTVFLSYRRSDTAQESAAVSNRVARRFGGRRVFCDVRSLRPGENFRQAIERTLRRCDAALVLVGPDWVTCRQENGKLRLHEPEDVVRNEVSAALESNALVIPVLVRGAAPPRADDLPNDLKGLTELQAVRLDPNHLEDSLTVTIHEIARAICRS